MAKLEQIQRLLYIVELLKSKPNGITYEETKGFLEEKFQERWDFFVSISFTSKISTHGSYRVAPGTFPLIFFFTSSTIYHFLPLFLRFL